MTEPTNDVTAYVQGFRDNLSNTPEQVKARLLPAVNADMNHAEPGVAFNIDIVNESHLPAQPQTKMAYLQPREIGQGRRGAYFVGTENYFHVDDFDKVRLAVDPTNAKMSAMIAKREQNRDKVVLDTMFGTTYSTNAAGQLVTANPFPSASFLSGGQVIPVDNRDNLHDSEAKVVAASGGLGLTVGKLITAKQILNASEIDGEEDYIAVTSQLLGQLLASTAGSSSDYNQVMALMNGKIDTYMGFRFIRYEKLTVSSSIADVPAWRKSAIEYKERSLVQSDISQRRDLGGLPWQFYYKDEQAAARKYDKGVVQIKAHISRQLA